MARGTAVGAGDQRVNAGGSGAAHPSGAACTTGTSVTARSEDPAARAAATATAAVAAVLARAGVISTVRSVPAGTADPAVATPARQRQSSHVPAATAAATIG